MNAERKAVKRNLMNLITHGYHVEYTEYTRINKKGLKESIYTDWYIEREFSDAELRVLIDSLLFSKNIPRNQCREIIGKLESLSNKYFQSRIGHIQTFQPKNMANNQILYTLEILDEAISKGKQVAFKYTQYGTDKKQYARTDQEGNIREYIINPYQVVASNGRYYLMCNSDKYDDLGYYRVDRILDIQMLDTKVKAKSKVNGLEKGFYLPKHMAEHIYMFPGESVSVKFRIKKYLVNEVIDWFGTDIKLEDESEDEITVRARVNIEAMRKWALQYAVHAKMLSPIRLVNMVKEDIETAMKWYKE